MIIDSANYTCPGGHDVNEDSFLCRNDRGLFIVADGLGGHSDGEIASKAAIDYFEQNCQGGYTDERLTALLEGANAQVLKHGEGGKTTMAAAFIESGNFIYANVGDSRVYLFRDGKIIAQTKDHSVCQASVDMGMMRPEDIRGSEDRSRLLKVLGGEETLSVKKHYTPVRLQQGDAFLICSDGFWDYVYETEMEADLLKSGSADVWLKYMLKRHILRAQNKGDNYTAICGIVHMEPGDNIPVENNIAADAIAPTVAFQETPEAVKPKQLPVKAVIIGIAAALVVAAAIIVTAILLNSNGDGDIEPDTSGTAEETPDESGETTPEETTENTDESTSSENEGSLPFASAEPEPSESEVPGSSEEEGSVPPEDEVPESSEEEGSVPSEDEAPESPEEEGSAPSEEEASAPSEDDELSLPDHFQPL